MTAEDRAAHVEREAVAALERLADQAWHTAGDTEGRERVREDRAAVLAALPQTGDAVALAARVEALAAEWESNPEPPEEDYEGTPEGHYAFGEHLAIRCCARELRAALTAGGSHV